MSIRLYKYCFPFLTYLGALQAFFSTGFFVFIPLLYAWVIIPLLELWIPPDHSNLSLMEEDLASGNKAYDWFLYLVLPLQYLALACFLYSVTFVPQPIPDLVGKTMVMGLLCGTFGINVGHELGHRVHKGEQLAAKALLLTSLYMHFFIEHNRGHHKRVATAEDPSSARYNETVYAFYFRSIIYSYLSAWQIANRDAAKQGIRTLSLKNGMVPLHLVQAGFCLLIGAAFGWTTLLLFILAAFMGILLLETVNYIEHYGLQRQSLGHGRYERAQPHHSWNSNHIIGRVMLFELSRHSDHHYLASRKYHLLRHHNNAPQMPTGYPGMMLLSLVPPLWFYVMNRMIRKMQHLNQPVLSFHQSGN